MLPAGNSKNSGFTFVELVTVIVILGILSVVVIPRCTLPSSYDARGYFDQLTVAARYAQNYAVASGCPVTFAIDSNDDYSLSLTGNATCASAATLSGPDMQNFAGNAPANVSATAVNVVFAADYTANPGATVAVSGGGFSDSFTIHAATGYVEVN